MRWLLVLCVLSPAVAFATVGPTAFELLARTADLVVIGVGEPARSATELGWVRVEQTLKGERQSQVRVLQPDDSTSCDTSAIVTGRTLYFLYKGGDGYRIMADGRGAVPITGQGSRATISVSDEYALSPKLSKACKDWSCPLSAVLREINPFITGKAPTAFVLNFGGEPTVLATVPTKSIRCTTRGEPADSPTPGPSYLGCTVAGSRDGGVAVAIGDLLCLGSPRGDEANCWALGSPTIKSDN